VNELPSISIVIPTYNAARVLGLCLESIRGQDYPRDKVELIIADAGSEDGSVEIARQFAADRILPNPLKTGEAGKAVGVRAATGEIIALVDSDNVLPGPDWLERMAEPFADAEIVGAEPIEYTHRPGDGYITRYCALMGMNDPLCFFLGNYDRYNYISQRWTAMPVEEEDCGPYLKVALDERRLPTIGANGFLVRREALLACDIGDYLFDIDVVYELTRMGRNRFAKVKTGIVHLFSGSVATFARKQRRRVRDYLYHRQAGQRKYPWGGLSKAGLLKFILYCLLLLPLLWQSASGYRRKADAAWWFHPLACWITLLTYGFGWLGGMFGAQAQDRERWSQ
jgi:glycosyltransferase involved in cell wall biosynthesis